MARFLALAIAMISTSSAHSAQPAENELQGMLVDISAMLMKHDQTGLRIGNFTCDGDAPSHHGPDLQRILVASLQARNVAVNRDALFEIQCEVSPVADGSASPRVHINAKLMNTKTGLGVANLSVICRTEEGMLRWPGEEDFRLGLARVRGQGQKVHLPDAVRAFRKSSGHGHPLASAHLAIFLCEGGAGEFDPEESLRLIRHALPDVRKSAVFGHTESQFAFGCLLAAGWGVEQDHAEALKWFRKAAERNLAPAVTRVGIAHLHGLGVDADSAEGLKWLRKSATANDVTGLYVMGRVHEFGNGVAQDFNEALKWYHKGAEIHDPAAFNNIGWFHANGHGVEKDDKLALKWYRIAAEQKHPAAQNSIGFFHAEGWGVDRDFTEAMKWYRKAADQNHAGAKNNIGVLFLNGSGVPKSIPEAIKWFRKAAKQGNPESKAWLKELGQADD